MATKTHHVVPSKDGDWIVRKGGSDQPSARTRTKQEAIDRAREISRNQKSELYIHNKDGRISGKDSHGNDPYPPEG